MCLRPLLHRRGRLHRGGGSDTLTLAERWSGKKWSIKRTPNPGTVHDLIAVSCASADSCIAVGDFMNKKLARVALAERWNGVKWSVRHTPDPAGATSTELHGVSCTSARACTAVGDFARGGVYRTLVERWNGKKWTIEHPPEPSGTETGQLQGVSCTSPRACTAVGSYQKTSTRARTLAERFNGKKWSIEKTPNPTNDPNKYLDGVSCTAADACTAAGYTSGNVIWDTTIVEQWNGHKWSVRRSPSPGSDSDLYGVSCSSTIDCTAAGFYETAHTGPEKTLVERR